LPARDIYVYDHHSIVFKRKVLNSLCGRTTIDERQVLLYYEHNNMGLVHSWNAAWLCTYKEAPKSLS